MNQPQIMDIDEHPQLKMYTGLFLSHNNIQCPVHHKTMIGKVKVIRTGYTQYVRAVMAIGICPEKDCNKWCEVKFNMVIWP